MKRLSVIFILFLFCMASNFVSKQALSVDDYIMSEHLTQRAFECFPGRTFIAQIGDYTGVLGALVRNICVSSDGNTIAVMYGPPSDPYDSNQPFDGVMIAYSTDRGMTWLHYGPHSSISPLRRIYPSVDGCENFHDQAGNLFFCWQEGQPDYDPTNDYSIIEENIPSFPSFSFPNILSGDIDGWFVCPAVNPDDNMNVIITANSKLANGNLANYCWISTDGGYAWTDTIRITPPVHSIYSGTSGSGHVRWGNGNYAFFTYTDTINNTDYPHYVETTNGGYTWSDPDTFPAISVIKHWWHERDCEVINNLPFAVHNDMDGIFQLFYPYPDDPGSQGSWNWTALNVDAVGDGAFSYQDTTWTVEIFMRPSISYDPDLDVILVSFRSIFSITPPPAGWTDGWYVGGIVSTDQGRSWFPCRPLSGPLLTGETTGLESAHRLVTVPSIPGTTYVYSTWTDAGYGQIGDQYFELGVVMAIQDTIFGPGYDPGVKENHEIDFVSGSPLAVLPTVARGGHRVSFNMLKPGQVSIKVFDISGRLVNTAFDGYLEEGKQNIDLNTINLPNGVYIVSFESLLRRDVAKFVKMY